MDLGGGLNEILQMGAGEEVAEVDELAVILIFDVDDTPAVLASTDLLASNNDGLLGSDNSEWDDVLCTISIVIPSYSLSSVLLTLICAFNARSSSSSSSLSYGYIFKLWKANSSLILTLKASRSSRVKESDLAITGTTLTTSESFLRTTISIGFNAWPDGWIKKRQQ